MKFSVTLTRSEDGGYSIDIDSGNDNLLQILRDSRSDSLVIFQALAKLVNAIEERTEEEKS